MALHDNASRGCSAASSIAIGAALREPRAVAGDRAGILAEYLTERQLADELGVTLRTLRNWRALGEAPPLTRIGKRIYFNLNDIKTWLQRQRIEDA